MSDGLTLIPGHLADLELAGATRATLRSKQHVLRMFSRHLAGDLIEATRTSVVTFLARPELSPQSRATYLIHLRGFYRWALDAGYVAEDPTEKIKGPRAKRGIPRPMAPSDLERAVAAANRTVRAWLLLGAYGGLRCFEMAQLRGEDLDLDSEPATMLIHGKGGRQDVVPLHPILVEELRYWPRSGYLFPHRHRPDDHVLASSVSTMINTHLHSVGITSTAHSTRHLFGTSIRRTSGGDIRVMQEALRHASPVTTAVYTKVENFEVAHAVNGLSYGPSPAGKVPRQKKEGPPAEAPTPPLRGPGGAKPCITRRSRLGISS